MKKWISLITIPLPWSLRRLLLERFCGWRIHPGARIGMSWIAPDRLEMDAGARIGHGTVCKGVSLLRMEEQTHLGNGNWITGFPDGAKGYFQHAQNRRPELILRRHSSITNRHIVDATDSIEIGEFTTVAGFRSQLLTHSIDLQRNRQDAAPISIGARCFLGTGVIVLGGATLPERSVLGALSLLRTAESEPCGLYSGVPAKRVKDLEPDSAYFHREQGHVH